MSFGLLQVFVELGNLHGTSNYVLYWIHGGHLSWFREGSPSSTNTWRRPGRYQTKRCGNYNKDEDNSPKTLNDRKVLFVKNDILERVGNVEYSFVELRLWSLCNKIMEYARTRTQWFNGYSQSKWTRVQILNETVCISHSANILGKGMNPTILPPAIGKIVWQTGFFHLALVTSLGERKIWN